MLLTYHDDDGMYFIESSIVETLYRVIHMRKFFTLGTELLWSLIWLFVLLVVGFFVLGWLSNTFSGNIVGTSASWVEQHAGPSY